MLNSVVRVVSGIVFLAVGGLVLRVGLRGLPEGVGDLCSAVGLPYTGEQLFHVDLRFVEIGSIEMRPIEILPFRSVKGVVVSLQLSDGAGIGKCGVVEGSFGCVYCVFLLEISRSFGPGLTVACRGVLF